MITDVWRRHWDISLIMLVVSIVGDSRNFPKFLVGSRPFVQLTRTKELLGVVIVPAHLKPTNAWRGAYLGDNGACHMNL